MPSTRIKRPPQSPNACSTEANPPHRRRRPPTLASADADRDQRARRRIQPPHDGYQVPVVDGHTECVSIKFTRPATHEQILAAWNEFKPLAGMDLPFAQKRWCGNYGVNRITMLSDHRTGSFGEKYGTLIPDLRIESRAIFVLDPDNKLRHVEYVKEVGDHPNYEAALAAAKAAVEETAISKS